MDSLDRCKIHKQVRLRAFFMSKSHEFFKSDYEHDTDN